MPVKSVNGALSGNPPLRAGAKKGLGWPLIGAYAQRPNVESAAARPTHLTLEPTPDCILSMGVKVLGQAARIGQVARETGLSIDTIRFYEKQGLLKHSGRTEGGFRVFGPDQIRSLKFIRKAQELGFSLQEIRELLLLQGERLEACEHVREHLEQKLASVRGKVEELQKLERGLVDALRKCNRELNELGTNHEERCPVLVELGSTTGNRES